MILLPPWNQHLSIMDLRLLFLPLRPPLSLRYPLDVFRPFLPFNIDALLSVNPHRKFSHHPPQSDKPLSLLISTLPPSLFLDCLPSTLKYENTFGTHPLQRIPPLPTSLLFPVLVFTSINDTVFHPKLKHRFPPTILMPTTNLSLLKILTNLPNLLPTILPLPVSVPTPHDSLLPCLVTSHFQFTTLHLVTFEMR